MGPPGSAADPLDPGTLFTKSLWRDPYIPANHFRWLFPGQAVLAHVGNKLLTAVQRSEHSDGRALPEEEARLRVLHGYWDACYQAGTHNTHCKKSRRVAKLSFDCILLRQIRLTIDEDRRAKRVPARDAPRRARRRQPHGAHHSAGDPTSNHLECGLRCQVEGRIRLHIEAD